MIINSQINLLRSPMFGLNLLLVSSIIFNRFQHPYLFETLHKSTKKPLYIGTVLVVITVSMKEAVQNEHNGENRKNEKKPSIGKEQEEADEQTEG